MLLSGHLDSRTEVCTWAAGGGGVPGGVCVGSMDLGLPHCSCSCKNLDSEVDLSLPTFFFLLYKEIIHFFQFAELFKE